MLSDIAYNQPQSYVFSKTPLKALSPDELLKMEIPAPKWLLEPFVPENGLVQVFADRGVGKTFFVLSLAIALATGKEFLGFKPTERCKVVWYDGEMASNIFKERLELLTKELSNLEKVYLNENCRFVLSGEQEFGMPDLGNPENYDYYDHWLHGVKVIILDNLLSLCTIPLNDNDAWAGFNQWCTSMRNKGVTVLHVHHSGRGSSNHAMGAKRIEQPLDLIIGLKPPKDHDVSQGCDFNIEFKKSRRRIGDAGKPFRAKLEPTGEWQRLEYLPDFDYKALQEEHGSLRKIAEITGQSKSTIQRKLKE